MGVEVGKSVRLLLAVSGGVWGGKGRRGKEEGKNGEGDEGGGGDLPVEGAGAVEEFEVEGCGGLAVDFPAGAGLHGHVLFFFFECG